MFADHCAACYSEDWESFEQSCLFLSNLILFNHMKHHNLGAPLNRMMIILIMYVEFNKKAKEITFFPVYISSMIYNFHSFNILFSLVTELHTTQRTDKCTDRIIKLSTSVALDGLNSMERQAAFIVSILIPFHVSKFPNP